MKTRFLWSKGLVKLGQRQSFTEFPMAYLTFWVVSFIINGQGFTFLLIGHKLFNIQNTTIDLQALKIRLLPVGRTKRIVPGKNDQTWLYNASSSLEEFAWCKYLLIVLSCPSCNMSVTTSCTRNIPTVKDYFLCLLFYDKWIFPIFRSWSKR